MSAELAVSKRPWFRWHHGVRHDRKLRLRCSPTERWCWAALLDLAGQLWDDGYYPGELWFSDGAPFGDADLANECGVDLEVIITALVKFRSMKMIEVRDDGLIVLCNFSKRQFIVSDSKEAVAARVAKFRKSKENKKTSNEKVTARNGIGNGNVTACNGPLCTESETDTERESETEKESTRTRKVPCPASRTISLAAIERLNALTKSKYSPDGKIQDRIAALAKRGHELAEFLLVVDFKCAQWGEDVKMSEYLRPKTLFSPENFENYLGAARAWEERGRPEANGHPGKRGVTTAQLDRLIDFAKSKEEGL